MMLSHDSKKFGTFFVQNYYALAIDSLVDLSGESSGEKFWERVYQKAYAFYKTNDIPQIATEIIIPEIEKEVNEGENFAPLRQIFS